MATFDYAAYAAAKAKRASGAVNNGERTPVEFLNNYLKSDGDSVVVRFPYHSMEDIVFESVHKVEDYPGRKWGAFVACTGEKDCPLCAAGNKKTTRFYAKMVVYAANDAGDIELKATLWDRPAAFADIDLKNLMDEYGDLTDSLFKIRRNGSGKDTRYTIVPVMNKTVYNPEIYKKDFTCLEDITPSKVLCKTMEQYQTALNGGTAVAAEVPAAAPTPAPVAPTVEVKDDPLPASFDTPAPAPVNAAPATEAPARKKYVF